MGLLPAPATPLLWDPTSPADVPRVTLPPASGLVLASRP